jgi:ABC-type transport system involved in multi-copper enzyme maturation permease subunit
MIPALKAEFRKLTTVRNTYVTTAFAALLILFFAGYVNGFRATPGMLMQSNVLTEQITSAITIVSIFAAIIAILLFSHEYRYNTIMYSLTSSRSRSQFLLAKILMVTMFSIAFTLAMGALSPMATLVGAKLAGHELATQIIPYSDLLWRCLLYGWGYAMVGLLLVSFARNQLFAIVALFIAPSTVELLLGLLLKKNQIYLPFTALGAVLNDHPGITHAKAAVVFLAYMVIGWLIAWLLFVRRDAN